MLKDGLGLATHSQGKDLPHRGDCVGRGQGEIQQLAYVHVHRYVRVYLQGSKSRGGTGKR